MFTLACAPVIKVACTSQATSCGTSVASTIARLNMRSHSDTDVLRVMMDVHVIHCFVQCCFPHRSGRRCAHPVPPQPAAPSARSTPRCRARRLHWRPLRPRDAWDRVVEMARGHTPAATAQESTNSDRRSVMRARLGSAFMRCAASRMTPSRTEIEPTQALTAPKARQRARSTPTLRRTQRAQAGLPPSQRDLVRRHTRHAFWHDRARPGEAAALSGGTAQPHRALSRRCGGSGSGRGTTDAGHTDSGGTGRSSGHAGAGAAAVPRVTGSAGSALGSPADGDGCSAAHMRRASSSGCGQLSTGSASGGGGGGARPGCGCHGKESCSHSESSSGQGCCGLHAISVRACAWAARTCA